MRSYFKELENQLINIINQSPLTIEAKYYILKGIFQEVTEIYNTWMNTEEQPIQEKETEINNNVSVKKVENEDGTASVTVSGSDVTEVINQAVKETQNKE